ncbi:MAG: hypothetical protein EP329_18015 [Deltaproteobacteria bacterium]|nr:MAG: hypothetical protein EP329_18015 [Deltaproteobacteria bacterium]
MKKLAPFAVALALVACGDDGGQQVETDTYLVPDDTLVPADTTPTDTDQADTKLPPQDTLPQGSNSLGYGPGQTSADGQPCVTYCTWNVVAGEDRDLTVVYKDAAGQPKVDAQVKWSIDAPESLARLTALSTYTDAQGLATVKLRSFDAGGTVTVTAKVSSDPDAGEVSFVVVLAVPPKPVLLASHEYVGNAGVANFTLRLFKANATGAPGCGVVHPDAGGQQPEPDVELGPFGFAQQAQVFELPGLEQDGEQLWTVQFVGPADGPSVNAVGCNDGVRVKFGDTAAALVYILDLPPRFRGSYRAETRVDLVSGTSGTFGSVVGAITQLFTHPGALVLKWACQDASGTLGTVCGYLVNDYGDPTVVGAVVTDAADAGFLALMESALGSNITITGQTMSEVFQDLRFLSNIGFSDEPSVPNPGFDGAMFPGGTSQEEWTHVRFHWKFSPECKYSGDIANCGWKNIPLEEIYGFRPSEVLSAGIDHSLALHIAYHEVTGMTYGPLVNALLERELLPLIFGDGTNGLPPIDSWEDLVSTILGDQYCLYYDDCCDYFAYRLEDQVPGWVAPFLPTACEAGIPAAASLIRNQLSKLNGPMSVGTPDGQGCASVDGNNDRWVDAWGTQANPCAWELTWPYNGETFAPDSSWRANVQ